MAKYIALELDLICACILISLCVCQPERERETKETKLFTLVTHNIALVLIAEGVAVLVNGVASRQAAVVNEIATFISYLLPPIICFFFFFYIIYNIFDLYVLFFNKFFLFSL